LAGSCRKSVRPAKPQDLRLLNPQSIREHAAVSRFEGFHGRGKAPYALPPYDPRLLDACAKRLGEEAGVDDLT
jgi:hypothetical protein